MHIQVVVEGFSVFPGLGQAPGFEGSLIRRGLVISITSHVMFLGLSRIYVNPAEPPKPEEAWSSHQVHRFVSLIFALGRSSSKKISEKFSQ